MHVATKKQISDIETPNIIKVSETTHLHRDPLFNTFGAVLHFFVEVQHLLGSTAHA